MVTNERGRRIAGAMKDGKNRSKLEEAERAVKRLTGRDDLYENEFSAIACLIADIGERSFARSPLCRMIQDAHSAGDWWIARSEFRKMAEMEAKPAKQRRRMAEAKLFSEPSLVANKRRTE